MLALKAVAFFPCTTVQLLLCKYVLSIFSRRGLGEHSREQTFLFISEHPASQSQEGWGSLGIIGVSVNPERFIQLVAYGNILLFLDNFSLYECTTSCRYSFFFGWWVSRFPVHGCTYKHADHVFDICSHPFRLGTYLRKKLPEHEQVKYGRMIEPNDGWIHSEWELPFSSTLTSCWQSYTKNISTLV